MTFVTKLPTVIRSVLAAARASMVQHSRTVVGAAPRPMKWSHAQIPAYPDVSRRRALSSHQSASDADDAEADADRLASAVEEGGRVRAGRWHRRRAAHAGHAA